MQSVGAFGGSRLGIRGDNLLKPAQPVASAAVSARRTPSSRFASSHAQGRWEGRDRKEPSQRGCSVRVAATCRATSGRRGRLGSWDETDRRAGGTARGGWSSIFYSRCHIDYGLRLRPKLTPGVSGTKGLINQRPPLKPSPTVSPGPRLSLLLALRFPLSGDRGRFLNLRIPGLPTRAQCRTPLRPPWTTQP